ncbi:MAG: beta-ketoacyl synthase N-terminal-like domain-containing protein [Bdellovibrionota bacterium]
MSDSSKIAIVGMSGVFPGGNSLEEFWQNIIQSRDCSSEVSPDRWLLSKDLAYSKEYGEKDRVGNVRGYFVDDWQCREKSLNIDHDLLQQLDPLFHLTLTAGARAFQDCQSSLLDLRRVSVLFGNIVLPTEFSSKIARHYLGSAFEKFLLSHPINNTDKVHPINAFPAAMPAYVLAKALNLQGGCFTLDAACASSLYALRMAVDALHFGKSDAVLVGGVSRPDPLYTQMGFTQLTALSKSGKARPFDQNADGLVVGEGAGFFVLKRLEDALAHNDRIYATIAGIGLSNDVNGGLMAPDSEGQLRAMRAAYEEAGWDVNDVDLIECHAAGTSLGDGIELMSLKSLWSPEQGVEERQFVNKCILGSVKANVGHLLTAAGASGLCRVLLAMQHKVLPPTANFSQAEAKYCLEDSPFEILKSPKNWERRDENILRRAAISGFGFGGINAHVLIEEWDELLSLSQSRKAKDHDGKSTSFAPISKPTFNISNENSRQVAIVGIESTLADSSNFCVLIDRIANLGEHFVGKSSEHCQSIQGYGWDCEGAENFRLNAFEELLIEIGKFKVPPIELQQMLPIQLLMLDVAYRALKVAGIKKKRHLKAGALIGLDLDAHANFFNCRWDIENKAKAWCEELGLKLSDDAFKEWVEALKDSVNPPLNANRTIGSLGSIVASRIAREFQFAGPSFTIANAENSGLRALEFAVDQIRLGRLDFAVVGAVDFAAETQAALSNCSYMQSQGEGIGPCNYNYSDGAVALVVKDLDLAIADGDKVYGVIGDISITTRLDGGGHKQSLLQPALCANIPSKAVTCNDSDMYSYLGSVGSATGLVNLVTKIALGNKLDRSLVQEKPADIKNKNVIVFNQNGKDCSYGLLDVACDADYFSTFEGLQDTAIQQSISKSDKSIVVTIDKKESFSIFQVTERVGAISSSILEQETTKVQYRQGNDPKPLGNRTAPLVDDSYAEIGALIEKTAYANYSAHQAYLCWHNQMLDNMGELLGKQLEMLGNGNLTIPSVDALYDADLFSVTPLISLDKYDGYNDDLRPEPFNSEKPWLDYEGCKEFAAGKIGSVLGGSFSIIDTYPRRTRLPEGPLLLCHRIMSVDAKARSLQSGSIVTEHDIFANAWYLDAGKIPTCIAVEAGQADLFLSSYLGIDFHSKGERVYRLLDAVVTFFDSLPSSGQTIRYDINIEGFFRQSSTILFRFSFEAKVNGKPLLSMKNGCAGFFTDKELDEGKGLVFSTLDQVQMQGCLTGGFTYPVPVEKAAYDDEQLEALRKGDYVACFGPAFSNLNFEDPAKLPDGMMRLVHRIKLIDPQGGRYGVGLVIGEADISPKDWFLSCHFVDDKVMPGTLMYECCLHTLRVYLMRIGWVGESNDITFEPIPGEQSRLKCRGQVLESTKKVRYEIIVRELGYRPEAYAIVDALMYADGKPIVEITNMTLRIPGLLKDKVFAIWDKNSKSLTNATNSNEISLYDTQSIKAFCEGKPSLAFGDRYKIFDGSERKIARLPRDPFRFIDRITGVNAPAWKLEAGGSIVAEYDVPENAWYFLAESQGIMPFSVLLETALQPCGWYSAYMGSALTSSEDLCYRNLAGYATQFMDVTPDIGTLTTEVRSTKISQSGGMLLQEFDFSLRAGEQMVYQGHTMFGFFTRQALAQQIGIRGVKDLLDHVSPAFSKNISYPGGDQYWPKSPLLMIDNIERYAAKGGSFGLGYIRGSKLVDADEWFFHAHFYQDPVMPGSLGLESFIQLLKVRAVDYWREARVPFNKISCIGGKHEWLYRGQVLPTNKKITVDVDVVSICPKTHAISARGYLQVDGLTIYEVKEFSVMPRQ